MVSIKPRLVFMAVTNIFSITSMAQAPTVQINLAANPCDDFFEYVCRPWVDANPMPSDQGRWGTFDRLGEQSRAQLKALIDEVSAERSGNNNKYAKGSLGQQVGDFYRSCMNEASIESMGIKPISDDFAGIGTIDSPKKLAGVLARLHQNGVSALFSFSGRPDAKDASRTVAYWDQSGLGLPDREYYLADDEKSKQQRTKYLAHVAAMFRAAKTGDEAALKRAEVVLAFETALAKTHVDKVVRRIPERAYNRVEKTTFIEGAPQLGLVEYLQTVKAPTFDWLVVTSPDGLKGVNDLLAKTSIEDLKVYLRWRVLNSYAPYLPNKFVVENFNFYDKELTGAKVIKARERRCIEATDRALPDSVGQLYVERHFGKDAKNRMDSMVKNVVNSFGDNLQTVAWMSPETRVVAKEKADTMGAKIGYPDKWRDTTTIQISDGNFLANFVQGRQYEHGRSIARIGQATDKTEWFMSAPTVNAFYNGSRNDINFPAGILQPPFFDLKADDALNYGAIGSVIGHEISHGFDDRGRKFDKNGNLTEWWKKEDAQNFEKAAQCVVDQYSGYTAVDDVKLNGKLTLGENIADLGGVRVSLKAYLKTLKGDVAKQIVGMNAVKNGQTSTVDLTPEQRFFVGYATVWCSQYRPEMARMRALTDSHSAPRWRINGVVANMPEFAQAFQCKPGQGMVREQQCRVW